MSKTNFEFLDALGQIAWRQGDLGRDAARRPGQRLVAAYKRRPDAAEEAVVTIDPDSGEIRVYGQELNEEGEVVREWDDTPDDFGRIAAQTAKQVILQRIREVERDMKYEEYAGREGDIVTGIVQQTDNRYTLLDLGKVEALLPQAEQVSYERYEHGARLKAYIVEVRKTTKGPQIVVSRTHPGPDQAALRARGARNRVGRGGDQGGGPRAGPPHQDRRVVQRPERRPRRGLRRRPRLAGAHGDQRAARRACRRGAVLGRPGRRDRERARSGTCARGPARRGDRHGHGDRERLPAVARHRQGGAERGPAARLTGWRIDIKSETQLAEEEAGGYGDQDWAEGEWVEDESGELVWKPAEGGEAMSAEEWSHQAEDTTEAPAAGSATAPAAAGAAPSAAEASGGAAARGGTTCGRGTGRQQSPPAEPAAVTDGPAAEVSKEAEA